MAILNIEWKARTTKLAEAEEALQQLHPVYKGLDHQLDTYFNVPNGRLKLREGNIEHALIHYERANTAGAKASTILLYQHQPDSHLKAVLTQALGVKIIVDKQRKIYFVDNVKIHFDIVQQLGTFIEVEAIDTDGSIGANKLRQQCEQYAALFAIAAENYIAESYSDLILSIRKAV